MATTPNYSLSIYNSSDTDVRFLDFRVAIAGTQTTSNFYVIDGALKEHSDAINTLKNSPQAYIVKANFASGIYNASVSGFTGYKANQLIILSLNQTNTGSVSININNSSNKNVMLYSDAGTLRNAIAGEFVENSAVLCYYDGTQFVAVGVPKGSAIYVDGEQRDILQISSSGAIESSGKQAGQPNGIATLDSDGKVEQVAKIADGAASGEAVYSGNAIKIPYVSENRIASITAYGENAQGGTTEAPVALTGVDSVQVCGKNMLPNKAKTNTVAGITFTVNPDKSVTAKGTATSWANIVIDADFSLPAGTYTLNSNIQTAGVNLVIGKDTSGKKNIAVSSTASKTFTLSDSIKHCVAYIAVAPDSVVDTTIRPMLNLGKTAMPYEPYKGNVTPLPIPRPLRRVGDVQDVCRTRVKSIYDKRIVLDGTESWYWYSDNSYIFASNFLADNKYGVAPGCSHYQGSPRHAPNENQVIINSNGTIAIKDPAWKNAEDAKAYLAAQKSAGTPVTVYYQSTAYDGTNGLDVCLTEYQTGFVEIDGETVRGSYAQNGERPYGIVVSPSTIVSQESLICSNANVENQNLNWGYVYASNNPIKDFIFGLIGSDITSTTELNAYFAAQKAAGTPVQVVYQLATPEQYATDPIDFNNDAGPLTVVTGGQVEVKMTDFVTDRTPAFLNKLDKTGDGSDVTVTFTEASTDTDIASGDKLSILFGKILKRFSTITSKFTTVEGDISDIVDGTTTVANATTAATADKVKNKLSLLSGGGQDTIIYDGSTAIAAAMNSSFIGAEPAFIKNSAFNKNFGSSAGTVCQGNDGRLSDARRSSNISMSLSGTNLSISYS